MNNLLIYMNQHNASFIATAIFGGLCLYLLWATMTGNFTVGVRIPFLFSIHPMKFIIFSLYNTTNNKKQLYNKYLEKMKLG